MFHGIIPMFHAIIPVFHGIIPMFHGIIPMFHGKKHHRSSFFQFFLKNRDRWETLHTIAAGGVAPHVTELAGALHKIGRWAWKSRTRPQLKILVMICEYMNIYIYDHL